MELDKSKLTGILPAIVTPTDMEGRIDNNATNKLISFLLEAGVSGIVPMGGTGEFTNIAPEQRVFFVETVVNLVSGKVPVIPGILSPGFGEAVATARDFKKAGADGIMLVTPFYARPTQEGIRDYFYEFSNRIDLPLILYDIPYRTGVSIEPSTVLRMVEDNPKIIGMKACNTDLAYFTRLIITVQDKISVLSGEEYLFLPHMILGAKGGILATCNVFPHLWVQMYRHLTEGNIFEAKRILFRLVPLLDATFSEMNPGPLKEAMAMVGLEVGHALRPLVVPGEQTMARLRAAVRQLQAKPV